MRPRTAVLALWLVGCGGTPGGYLPPGTDAMAGDAGGSQADAAAAGGADAGGGTPDAPLVIADAAADAPDAPVVSPDAPLPGADGAPGGGDAALGDAAPVDARAADGGVIPDAASCPPLMTTLDPDAPYLEHIADETTDVTSVVVGDGPFSCSLYTGPGRGTMPGGVALDGCAVTGGAGETDLAGTYGFIVTVTDGCSAVDVPIAFHNGDCDPLVTLTPASWPPRMPVSPTAGYAWQMDAVMDILPKDQTCSVCTRLGLFTRSPFTFTNNFDCSQSGVVCFDCGSGCIDSFTCADATTQFSGAVTVKAHAPLRPGLPGWATLAVTNFTWSGTSLDPCGGNTWTCHLETLER